MRTYLAALRLTVYLAILASFLGAGACKTGSGPAPIVPNVVSGIVDCAEPSLWKVVNFQTLIPIAEHAIAQRDPMGALTALVEEYGEAEIACVAAHIHDTGTKQAISAPSNETVSTRVRVTADWLKRARSNGLEPTNFGGQVQ